MALEHTWERSDQRRGGLQQEQPGRARSFKTLDSLSRRKLALPDEHAFANWWKADG